MADTGWVIAGSGQNNTILGGTDWANPGNITADDGSRATSGNTGFPDSTRYLRAYNFGFAIPAGATIDGMEVRAQRHAGAGVINDVSIRLFISEFTLTGDDKSVGASWSTTPDTVATFGGATDLWGATPTEAQVEDAGWGWGMVGDDTSGFQTLFCDVMEMKIYYTGGSQDVQRALLPHRVPSLMW
jgi:hypothetical protein